MFLQKDRSNIEALRFGKGKSVGNIILAQYEPDKSRLWNGIRGVGLASDKYDSPATWKLNGFRGNIRYSKIFNFYRTFFLVPVYSLWTDGNLERRSIVYVSPRQKNFVAFSLRVCNNVNLHLLRNPYDTNSSDIIEYSNFINILNGRKINLYFFRRWKYR